MPGGGGPHSQQSAGFGLVHGGGVGEGEAFGSGLGLGLSSGVGVGSVRKQVLPVGSSHVHLRVGSDSAGQVMVLVT